MKKTLLICIFFLTECIGYSQTSVFQDGKGESAFKLFGNGIVLNTKDESLSAAVNVFRRGSATKFTRWGINLNLLAKDGIASLKTGDGFLINGNLGLFRGWKNASDPHSLKTAWAYETYVSANLVIERNKLYDINRLTDNVFDQGNAGWKIAVGRSGYYGNWLFGGEINFGQSTNSKDLDALTVSTIQSGSTDLIKIYKEQSAFDKSEFKGKQFNVHLNADIAYDITGKASAGSTDVPPIFGAFHFRYVILESSKPQFNPAIGFYFGNPGNPTSIVGGFNIQETDVFNVLDAKNSSFFKRLGINITAGFKL